MASEVQVAVTALTTNCNFEVINAEDYIEFDLEHKVMLEPYSKLSVSSMPYILQELIDKNNLAVNVSATNLDTLRFTADVPFMISDMSYNARLVTGAYCSKFPLKSEPYEEEQSLIIKEDKNITNIVFNDINIREGDVRPIQFVVTPPDAHGYYIEYSSSHEEYAVINGGYVQGIKGGTNPGEHSVATITAHVRNPGTSMVSKPDFTCTFKVGVFTRDRVEVTSIDMIEQITIYEGETFDVFPLINPVQADYLEYWESEKNDIATFNDNTVTGIKPGVTNVTYMIKYNLEEEQKTHTKTINVVVKSSTAMVTKHRITIDSVGYLLSTPVLYLLTNLGTAVFFNEIDDESKLQCGTVAMKLSNSWAGSFPIVAEQTEIVTRAHIGLATDFWVWLVDANMREVKLLNPMYITVQIGALPQSVVTPGLIDPSQQQAG